VEGVRNIATNVPRLHTEGVRIGINLDLWVKGRATMSAIKAEQAERYGEKK